MHLGSLGFLNGAELSSDIFSKAIPQLPSSYYMWMSLEGIDIETTELGRDARIDVAAYITCKFDERISRRASEERALHVTPRSFVQVGLGDSIVSVVHRNGHWRSRDPGPREGVVWWWGRFWRML